MSTTQEWWWYQGQRPKIKKTLEDKKWTPIAFVGLSKHRRRISSFTKIGGQPP